MTGLGGKDHAAVKELARLVHDGHLAAGAIARVKRQHAGAADGARGEKPLEVLGKDLDGLGLGAHGQAGTLLALKGGGHEPLVAVGHGRVQVGREGALAARPACAQAGHGGRLVHGHADAQLALALAAVHGQDAVVGNLAQGLGVVVVGLVGGLLGGVHGHGADVCGGLGEGAQVGHVLRVLGHGLGHDVLGARKGLLGGVEASLGVDVPLGGGQRSSLGADLHDHHVGKRLQACLAGLLRAGLALLAVGLVEVLHALQLRGGVYLCLELGSELALDLDEEKDVALALLEVAQVAQAFLEGAQGDVVHAVGGLLAVARDEGDGVALVDEADGRADGLRLEPQLLRERGNYVHVLCPRLLLVPMCIRPLGYPKVRQRGRSALSMRDRILSMSTAKRGLPSVSYLLR